MKILECRGSEHSITFLDGRARSSPTYCICSDHFFGVFTLDVHTPFTYGMHRTQPMSSYTEFVMTVGVSAVPYPISTFQ
jgi:hypothetical protein